MRHFNYQDIPVPKGFEGYRNEFISPYSLEIGCGNGDFSIYWSNNNPDKNLIAIEKTTNKFKKFSEKIKEKNKVIHDENYNYVYSNNLLAIHANAIDWVTHFVDSEFLENIYINYPNPYPKKSQANKRFANMPFMGFLKSRLIKGGKIFFASNIKSYVDETELQLTKAWNMKTVDNYCLNNKSLALTAFENKFLNTEQTCYHLVCEKN